jgi:predicted P-loop ATPase
MSSTVTDIELERLRSRARAAGIEDVEISTEVELRTALERMAWTDSLTKQGSTVVGNERNILYALRSAPELRGLVRFDEFALAIELTRAPPWRTREPLRWTDEDDTELTGWLQEAGIAVRGRNVVTDCVAVVAREHRVHPVREYLNGLEWDKHPRLNSWLATYLAADADDEYLRSVGQCWLVSAVARIYEPGCKADYVLVLESEQGTRKSTAAAVLAVNAEWFADAIGDLRNKDSAIQLCGKWIIELSELSSVRRAELEAVKSYLTRTQDTYRPPYGRRAVTVPRQCVFIGTTNEKQYLRDRTGNRRYWPVRCGQIDIDALRRDVAQLWAEAIVAYRDEIPWHLPPELEATAACEQDHRLHRSELDTLVAEYLEREDELGHTEITTRAIFKHALNLDPMGEKYAEQSQKLGAQVAIAIEAAGWERVRRIGRAKQTLYAKVDRGGQVKSIPLRARARIEKKTEKPPSTPVHLSRDCPDCDGRGCDTCGEWR